MALDEESRLLLESALAKHSPSPDMSPEELRRHALALGRMLQGEPLHLVRIEDRAVPSAEADVPIRIYYPSETHSAGGLLWLHGGGFTTGGLDTHDTLCRRISSLSEQVVISVDYRLAPEHKFPAAAVDSYAVLAWAVENSAELGLDRDRLAVGGSSAGGNLAAVVALMARDRGGPKIRHQLLVYPALDATMSEETFKMYASGYQLTSKMMADYWSKYIGTGTNLKDPYLSPVWAESLAGLPPAHIITAENDPLRGENERYAIRLAEAGVPVKVTSFSGVMHGFFAQAGVLRKARDAQEIACGALKEALSL